MSQLQVRFGRVAAVATLVSLAVLARPASASEVRVHGSTVAASVGAVFVLPGEAVPVEAPAPRAGSDVSVRVSAGSLDRDARDRWTWHAPDAVGTYRIDIQGADARPQITVNAFVMVPASAITRGSLNGYTIGQYPPRSVIRTVVYTPPAGFIEVTRTNENTELAPNIRLKDFVCKETGAYPKYVVLQEPLIARLERVEEMLETRGFGPHAVHLMSGYRTPAYNRAIGNETTYSMHVFGGAADLVIDVDLNGDGRIDRNDAVALARMIDDLERAPSRDTMTGGLGIYRATAAHGPFVHVDVRPAIARWGE